MRRGGRLLSLCLGSALAGIGGLREVEARCVNTTTGVVVTAVTGQPTSNQTVVCDTIAPNPPPASTVISGAAGSTNVNVTVLPGSILSSTARAIGVVNNSTVLNQGQVSTSGLNAFGISTTGNGSTLTNQGAITTVGSRGFGLDARGSNSTLINAGTINVSGSNAAGVRSTESTASTLITNSGAITVTGSGASPDFAAGVLFQAGAAGTFVNQAGGTVSSLTDSGVRGANADIIVRNAGTITGGNGIAINLGNGNDLVEVTAGQINGDIVSGTGNDQFTMNGGAVTGNVNVGDGTNMVSLSAGTIGGSVTLGVGNGAFSQSGGVVAGSVTLGAGNGTYSQSGGTVSGSVTIGPGNGIFALSNGTIGGSVTMLDGANQATVSGGTIGGNLITGNGNDQFLWTGGTIVGGLNLGAGDDVAMLRNLTDANLPGTPYSGGTGTDRVTLDNVTVTGASRFTLWEAVALTNGTRLTLDGGGMTLGDAGTLTGTLSIDSTSTLFAGNGANARIAPFTPGQLVTLTNSGTIDLTNGGAAAANSLTIVGNYMGAGGSLKLRSVLAGSGAPSDKLVLSGGQGSGSTAISVTNAGGQGAITTGNGILVVQAVNGATTTGSAFSLSGRVAAGAFEYQLFRGGFSAGTGSNWYLRNTIRPGTLADSIGSDPGGTDDGGDPGGGAGVIILYRPEVALAAVVPAVARAAVRSTLGTFHDREGEQAYASGDGGFRAGWARVFGGRYSQSWSGDVSPAFDGNIWGIQAGLPLLGLEHDSGEKDRAGLFFGYSTASGSVTGFAVGQRNAPVGNVGVNSYSFGGYWTHFWPAGGYLDAVLMNSWLTSTTQSLFNVSSSNLGRILTASLELGYPIALLANWAIEPQAQLIFQHQGLDLRNDTFSQISYVQGDVFTGRFGARLVGNFLTDKMAVRTFLLANLWHDFGGQDTVAFNATPILTDHGVTALEVGGGVSASMGKWVDAYAKVSYTTNVDGNTQNSITGRLGFRLIW